MLVVRAGVIFLAMVLSTRGPAFAGDSLTAQQIVDGVVRAEGGMDRIRAITSERSIYEGQVHGITQIATTLTKAPNRVLLTWDYPQLKYTGQHHTLYAGFDGKHAWRRSSDGDFNLGNASQTRNLIMVAAMANSSYLIPGRWPTQVTRIANRAFHGKNCYVLHIVPRGGDSVDVLIDQNTYAPIGTSYTQPGSGFQQISYCLDYVPKVGCKRFTMNFRDGDNIGNLVSDDRRAGASDDQFAPTEDVADGTTADLLARYTAAMGGVSAIGAESSLTLDGISARNKAFTIRLVTKTPQKYALELRAPGVASRRMFSGTASYLQGSRGSIPVPPDTWKLEAIGFNACALRAAACGVRVNRVGAVRIGDETLYNLRVALIADPRITYNVLLDQASFLPRFLRIGAYRILLGDYRALPSGMKYPATWLFNSPDYNLDVENMNAVENAASDDEFTPQPH